jgi:hypothetical protein
MSESRKGIKQRPEHIAASLLGKELAKQKRGNH